MYKPHRPTTGVGWTVLMFIILAVIGFGCTAGLRQHGIDSCRDRGGTPITRSWLSEGAWDVSCIEVP